MASKKDTQAVATEYTENHGNAITYANEVLAIIAGLAAAEVEGITSMCSVSGNILGRSKSNVTKGVKIEVGTEEVGCDLYVIIEYGQPIQKVAQEAQEGVRRAIENMTGLKVVRVDVHVLGVSFEKENNALTAGAQKASLTAGEKKADKKAEKKAEKKEKAVKAETVEEVKPEVTEEAVQPEVTTETEEVKTEE